MGLGSTLSNLCCTIEGLRTLKKSFSFIVGGCFIAISILSFLFGGLINPVTAIRAIWNVIFGILIIMLQFGKLKWIITRFGFLGHWFGRALFYLFCGTNILLIDPNGGFCIWCFFTWVIGGMCMFVGLVELIFGCRCESDDDKRLPEHSTAANAGAPGVAFGQPAAMEPSAGGGRSRGKTKTFSNVFASGGGGCQVDPSNGGAGAAEPSFTVNMTGGAADGGTSGTRAAPSANSDNPFFGNAHLTK